MKTQRRVVPMRVASPNRAIVDVVRTMQLTIREIASAQLLSHYDFFL
jgi:hypothetical protein